MQRKRKQRRVGRRTRPMTTESMTLTPQESQKITRFGTNYTYELLRRGEMPSIRVGSRFFIPKAALMKWLESAGDKPINAA
jgi:excisionase family DNA binding protein